jgi:flagellar motor switch protein FliG
MSGAEYAAVLLLSLGEHDAAKVLRHLDAHVVQIVGTAMANLHNVRRDQADQVLERFANDLDEQTSLGVGADEYVRKVLVNALGKDEANDLVDRIMLGRNGKGLEALKWMESRSIADMIAQEHPQIIALVLAHLEADQAAEVLGYLPEGIRGDAVIRVATLSGVQPHALHELNQIMESQFAGSAARVRAAKIGGPKAAADILNNLETRHDGTLLGEIKEVDSALGGEIEELMFTFEDLAGLDDRSMQTLLRKAPSNKLVAALKGSDEALRQRFFSNMSQRAAAMLRDDLEVSMPMRLSEVDAAQKEILAVARKLADDGTITLGTSEDMV